MVWYPSSSIVFIKISFFLSILPLALVPWTNPRSPISFDVLLMLLMLMRVANFCCFFRVMKRKPWFVCSSSSELLQMRSCEEFHTVFFCCCDPYLCHISNRSRFRGVVLQCDICNMMHIIVWGGSSPDPPGLKFGHGIPCVVNLVGTVIDKLCREQSGIAPPYTAYTAPVRLSRRPCLI